MTRTVPGAGPIAIIGTGVIGASWVAHFLRLGFDVVASDPSAGAEERLRSSIRELWPVLERLGLAEHASVDRLSFVSEAAVAAEAARFVQENAPEDLRLKQQLIRVLDEAAPLSTIIASSSSAIRPTDLQAVCTRAPGRVVVGHPFHPPHLMPLVEVVGGERTESTALTAAMELYRSVDKEPILVRKEVVGHVANRLQAALWREAFSLVDQDVISVADLDKAIESGPGMRWALRGPFATLALTGGDGGMPHVLEHLGHAMTSMWADLGSPNLDEELSHKVVEGVQEEARMLGVTATQEARDAHLIELITSKRAARAEASR